MRKIRQLSTLLFLCLLMTSYQNCSNMNGFELQTHEQELASNAPTAVELSCLDPNTSQLVAPGTTLISFSAPSAATQSGCDAFRITSVCQGLNGMFSPAPQAASSCLVTGQTCAYTNATGRAAPTGNMMGATVTGFSQPSAVYPTLCGSQVTRTCQSSGQWSGTTPLYTSCAQSCLHPDTSQAVASGTSYGAYWTRNSGTQAECDAARIAAASSTCSATTGLFAPALPNTRYASCTVVNGGGNSGTQKNSAYIFFSGHSLINWPIAPDTEAIANSKGTPARHNIQQVSGSSIRQRTRGDAVEGSGQYPAYSTGLNREGSNMNVINELLNPQTIGAGNRYDTLVITERHDLITALFYEKTPKYLRHYHERFLAGNANGQTYFYHPWLSMVKTKPQEWLAYEQEAAKGWACVVTRVNHSLAAEGRPDRIRNLPAASAFAFLVNRALTTNVPGISGANTMATLNNLLSDDVHLTRLGGYYLGAVVYASVYRRSPVGALNDGITATQAASLQAIAWEFVSNYYATFTEPTLAQCQALAPNLCNAFWNFDWIYANRPSEIPGCRSQMTQTNQENNPFYYNSATDASYWLPAPR